MDNEHPELVDDAIPGDTPEDVAVLYSWANLQGAKYRDFSASRREYRAQLRHRAAEEQRLAEAQAQAEAEAAALEAEKAAREAEEAARFHETAARRAAQAHDTQDQTAEEEARERAMRHAAEMSRIAAAERIEAARRAEAVAAAEAASRREAREMDEARASAERQAARYAESEVRRRELTGPQPTYVPGQISDPYQSNLVQNLPGRIFHQPHVPDDDDMLPSRHHPQSREARLIIPQPDPAHPDAILEREYLATGSLRQDAEIAARGTRAIADAANKPDSPVRHYYAAPNTAEQTAAVDQYARKSSRARRPGDDAADGFSSAFVPAVVPVHPSRSASGDRNFIASVAHEVRHGDSPARPIPAALMGTVSSASHPVAVLSAAPPRDLSPEVRYEDSRREEIRQEELEEEVEFHPLPGSILGLEPPAPASRTRSTRTSAPRTPDAGPRRSAEVETSGIRPGASSILGLESPAPAARVPEPVRAQPEEREFRPVSGSILGLEPPPPAPIAPAREPSVGQRAYAAAKAEAAGKAEAAQAAVVRRRGYSPDEASGFFNAYGSARAQHIAAVEPEPVVPEWLNGSSAIVAATPVSPEAHATPVPEPTRKRVPSGNNISAAAPTLETLQNSRERVAARWYALKGVFDHGQEQLAEKEAERERERSVPIVSVFSLAGGVGKTSLVATLGRALSSTGERALLTDTTSHGLLPFYFGASELRPGVMRTFSPPSGTADAPIFLLSYDILQKTGDAASQDWLGTEIEAKSKGMSRMILDLSAATPWVARRLARMDSTVLIPVLPDMNSVISLGAVEKFFSEMKDSQGRSVEPYYVLNQFDSSQPLHLDVREVMRQQLAERLLPFVIRRAPAVPEALAEGMTVMDYAPEAPIAEDYRNLANWLKSHAAPAVTGQKTARWSER